MGQCNLYLGAAKDPQIEEAIKTYLENVCNPNIQEMKKILEERCYPLPAPLEETTSPAQRAFITGANSGIGAAITHA